MSLKLFLDSAALISGVLTSDDGDPMRRIVALGASNVLDLRISREVQGDVQRFIDKRNPDMKRIMAALIVEGNIATTPDPARETIERCLALAGYLPDARILSTALECAADVLVTYDAQHLLGNKKIAPPEASILVLTPRDAIEWCYEQWIRIIGKH